MTATWTPTPDSTTPARLPLSIPTTARAARSGAGRRALRIAGVVLVVVLVIFFVGPIFWVVWGSIRNDGALSGANYARLVTYGEGLGTYLANTGVVVLLTVVGSLVVSVLAGYAFARLAFPGSKALFVGILAILMVPHTSLLIPLYIWLDRLSLGNSLVGVSLVMIMYQMPFSVFMMRNAFESVPPELEEAALMDGCSPFGALRRVVLPAVAPGTITVALFAFLASWNEFVTPLILLSDGNKYTLPLALVNLVQGDWGMIDFGALQAGIIISAAPCIALFFFLQRAFVNGFTNGAVKG
ncbi:carbohydrate ABC transporter permease [Cellulomonas sp. KRMCY2]|uniref:carbohydrate ABC transporter permease n=1 Tax=Cellulomonas sp. KRMCY2 TaxID=1304865 RepID=UPI00045E593A|nr:carbohydrate ABC transporter permease [Cellulomonas sp. KRMCY2]